MLSALMNSLIAAVICIDSDGKVADFCMSRRSDVRIRRVRGQDFQRLLRLVFGAAAAAVGEAYKSAAASGQTRQLQFSYETVRGMVEHFEWRFAPGDAPGEIVACVQNVTESKCLEEEFSIVSRQNEETNRELLAAMSKLDFRLMDLDQAHKKLAALYRITSVVQRTVDEAEVLEEIVAGITSELGYTSAAVLLLDEERQELVMRASRGYPSNVRVPAGVGVTWHALKTRKMIYVPDVSKEHRYIRTTGRAISEVAVPLIYADKVIGVLDVESSEDRQLSPYDRDLLGSLAGQVALTIAHAQRVSRVEVQAITDGLTGLYNYRYFLSSLDREFKRAARYKRPLALLMIDIDNFKRYNDANGHTLGNEVLATLAELLRRMSRDVDFVARYGGEEFIAVFPETSLDEACKVAERIRAAVAEHPFVGRETQQGGILTVSIGVAAYPQDANSDRELLEHADRALYLAKRATKNCVMTFPLSYAAKGVPKKAVKAAKAPKQEDRTAEK